MTDPSPRASLSINVEFKPFPKRFWDDPRLQRRLMDRFAEQRGIPKVPEGWKGVTSRDIHLAGIPFSTRSLVSNDPPPLYIAPLISSHYSRFSPGQLSGVMQQVNVPSFWEADGDPTNPGGVRCGVIQSIALLLYQMLFGIKEF